MRKISEIVLTLLVCCGTLCIAFLIVGGIYNTTYQSVLPNFDGVFEEYDVVKLHHADMKEFIKIQKEMGNNWKVTKIDTSLFTPSLYYLILINE